MYRTFIDRRCDCFGEPHPEWMKWTHSAIKVRVIIFVLYTIYTQDIPKQTNSIDCGVFISQVSKLIHGNHTIHMENYHFSVCIISYKETCHGLPSGIRIIIIHNMQDMIYNTQQGQMDEIRHVMAEELLSGRLM